MLDVSGARALVALGAALLAACDGNGEGLDANGQPLGSAGARFAVVATFPEDQAVVVPEVARIVVAFSHEPDASLINDTTVHLERLGTDAPEPAGPIFMRLADG